MEGKMEGKLCYVCSPYRGDTARNVAYAQELTRRAALKGYAPITPHLYLTQALDDEDRAERALRMEAGMHLLTSCEAIMIGGRYGISEGMRHEIERAHRLGKTFLYADTMETNVVDAAFLREMGKRPDGEEQKQEFIHLLSFVERDGVQSLLEWLESTDFYMAPASGGELPADGQHMTFRDGRVTLEPGAEINMGKPLDLHLHLADMEATWFDEGRGPQG